MAGRSLSRASSFTIDFEPKERHFFLRFDRSTMSELKSFSAPPQLVKEVMKAGLLLLGQPESITRDWAKSRSFCKVDSTGPSNLNTRTASLDIGEVHPEIIARAKQILDGVSRENVMKVSNGGISILFDWIIKTISEGESRHGNLEAVKPADDKRQLELLTKSETLSGESRPKKAVNLEPLDQRKFRHLLMNPQ